MKKIDEIIKHNEDIIKTLEERITKNEEVKTEYDRYYTEQIKSDRNEIVEIGLALIELRKI